MQKLIGSALILIAIIGAGFFIVDCVYANYQWQNQYLSYWTLSDKASSIQQKSTYLDQFVSALQGSGLQGTQDSIWFPTPDNSFNQNFVALQSLQSRLHDVQTMDPNSFQYNTAIEQITSQEQDGGTDMINNFSDDWYKVHHYFLWNGWTLLGIIIGTILAFLLGCLMAFADMD